MPSGNRNVPTAEPRRLHAIASPTPHARASVGKHSGGNTPTRFENADIVSVKTPNATIIAIVADDGSTARASSETHVIANDPIKKPRRESLIVSQMPITAPSTRKPLSSKSARQPPSRWIADRMLGRNV